MSLDIYAFIFTSFVPLTHHSVCHHDETAELHCYDLIHDAEQPAPHILDVSLFLHNLALRGAVDRLDSVRHAQLLAEPQ